MSQDFFHYGNSYLFMVARCTVANISLTTCSPCSPSTGCTCPNSFSVSLPSHTVHFLTSYAPNAPPPIYQGVEISYGIPHYILGYAQIRCGNGGWWSASWRWLWHGLGGHRCWREETACRDDDARFCAFSFGHITRSGFLFRKCVPLVRTFCADIYRTGERERHVGWAAENEEHPQQPQSQPRAGS